MRTASPDLVACGISRFTIGFVVALATATPARTADADELERARLHIETGTDHFRAERFDAAVKEFRKALGVLEEPGLVWNIARAYEELDDVANAVHYFRQFAEQYPDHASVPDAERRIDALLLRMPGLVLVRCGSVPSARITVDGDRTEECGKRIRGLAPGRHLVEASDPEQGVWRTEVYLDPGQRLEVSVDWSMARRADGSVQAVDVLPPKPPETLLSAWPLWLTAVAGTALVAGGVVAALESADAADRYEALKSEASVNLGAVDLAAERSNTMASAANVLLLSGGAALAIGGGLLWFGFDGAVIEADAPPSFGAGVRGRW